MVFIGEAPGEMEVRLGRPFVGPAGNLFDQCLHSAKLIRRDVYITNLCKTKLAKNNADVLMNPRTGEFTERGKLCVRELQEELNALPNVKIVVAMGNLAWAALTYNGGTGRGRTKISKYRGYIYPRSAVDGGKVPPPVLPTLHPAAAIHGRGNFINRYYTSHDFQKAKKFADGTWDIEVPRVITPDTLEEAIAILEQFKRVKRFAFDIEVANYEVSCISFCCDAQSITKDDDGTTYKGITFSIPFYQVWSEEEERRLWVLVSEVLENPESTKVVQNGIFDIGFLATRNGILVAGPIRDTMIAHHLIYPEMLKGLKFLGSFYTNYEYWADLVNFKNIKGEA
jgi:uracil-DNA glycosylase family 4